MHFKHLRFHEGFFLISPILHPEFIENLYQDFLKDPNSVDPELKKFFEGFDFAIGNGQGAVLMEMQRLLQTAAPVSTRWR